MVPADVAPVADFKQLLKPHAADARPHRDAAVRAVVLAVQTRRAELIEQRLLDAERVSARRKLSATEKELSDVIFEQTGGTQDFALIRSKGDQALFSKSTQAMKAQWKVPDGRPLADFAPTIILKAKDFATEITIFNAREHKLAASAPSPRSTSPTMKPFATPCWNVASDPKTCHRQKT